MSKVHSGGLTPGYQKVIIGILPVQDVSATCLLLKNQTPRVRNQSGNQKPGNGAPRQDGNQSWNQRPGNGAPRQDGNYHSNDRTHEEKQAHHDGLQVNVVNYNTGLIKHFAQLLKGKIQGTFIPSATDIFPLLGNRFIQEP